MELVVAIMIIVAIDLAAILGGADSRLGIDDEPHRAI
jgi:hypothetical protein